VSIAAIHNLPSQTTPFVGRTQELTEILDLLNNTACRLLTLVGPGGIGKTRLALEAGGRLLDAYADGVYFVPLQVLDSPDLIIQAITETLSLPLDQCCDPREQLLCQLQPRSLLLILDNFEHLLEGADLVSDILTEAPDVKIIVTSREALNLQEEWLWPVRAMHYPDLATAQQEGDLRLEDYSAVQLFVQSAQRIRPDFSPDHEALGVARICALVEGMPLGLELAAAWVRVLSCDEIAREIQRSLDFLETRARNVPPRHRSMRVVLDHSWNLLTSDEQDIFKRLSVFRGSFTRDAAAAVAGATLTTLSALVDKSLVRRDTSELYDLHELVRQYAERELNASLDESLQAHHDHARYYMSFLGQQWGDLLGSRPKEALQAIEQEMKNVRAAWGWASVHLLEADLLRGLDSLGFFYDTRGWYRDGEKMLALAAESVRGGSQDPQRSLLLGKILAWQGMLCNSLTRFDDARALLQEGLAIFHRLESGPDIAFGLGRLGEVADFEGRTPDARRYFEESLQVYRAVGDRWGEAWVLNWLGILADESDTRHALVKQSAAIFRELGSLWGTAVLIPIQGFMAIPEGDYAEVRRIAQEGLVLCREIGIQWGVALSYWLLGYSDQAMGNYRDAVQAFTQALRISMDIHLPRYVAYTAYGMGQILGTLGLDEQALEAFAIAYHYFSGHQEKPDFIDFQSVASPEMLAAIQARARTIDPDAALKALLAELPGSAGPVAAASPETVLAPGGEALTGRELEILTLAAAGMSNRDIAERLFLSTGTVKWYLSQVYGKLGVSSRTQAVAYARERGLISG
jgi:predicted ATPase/DNA-binding CsgD family transcriptional regulator